MVNLDVLQHDRLTLGVDDVQVGVLKNSNQVRVRGCSESKNGGALQSQVGLEV